MKKLFINLSNHPSSTWSDKQLQAAKEIGDIIDVPFPNVPPTASTEDIEKLAIIVAKKLNRIVEVENETTYWNTTICISGEFSLVIALLNYMYDPVDTITFVVATSERNTTILSDGRKIVAFDFVQFRDISTIGRHLW